MKLVCTALLCLLAPTNAAQSQKSMDAQIFKICKNAPAIGGDYDTSAAQMDALLAAGGKADGFKNARGTTALIKCASNERADLVKKLIKAGADVNYQAAPGWTAMQMAGTTGDTRTAELLIEAGADIDMPDSFGVTPFMHACKEGRTELVELLIEHDADVSALDNAYKGDRPNRWNALVYAAEGGYTALVSYLKEIGLELPFEKDDNHDRADGIDPYSEIFNSANILGGTPEAEEGIANAKVYLDEGIDPDMFKDSKQSTALIKAAVKNNHKFIEMLSKYKVDVNHRTAEAQSGEVLDATGTPVPGLGTPTDAGASAKEGFTALHVATATNHIECVKALLTGFPHIVVDVVDNGGRTALIWAAKNGRQEIAEELLKKNANPNIKDKEGKTALQYIKKNRQGVMPPLFTILEKASKEYLSWDDKIELMSRTQTDIVGEARKKAAEGREEL